MISQKIFAHKVYGTIGTRIQNSLDHHFLRDDGTGTGQPRNNGFSHAKVHPSSTFFSLGDEVYHTGGQNSSTARHEIAHEKSTTLYGQGGRTQSLRSAPYLLSEFLVKILSHTSISKTYCASAPLIKATFTHRFRAARRISLFLVFPFAIAVRPSDRLTSRRDYHFLVSSVTTRVRDGLLY